MEGDGYLCRGECAGGEKDALCWIPISEHPVTARRSHSELSHYAAVNATRPNHDLLVKHQVIRVVYPNGLDSEPPVVEVRSRTDNRVFNITAGAEVYLGEAPFIHQRFCTGAGSGQSSVLAAGILLVLDLPVLGPTFKTTPGLQSMEL